MLASTSEGSNSVKVAYVIAAYRTEGNKNGTKFTFHEHIVTFLDYTRNARVHTKFINVPFYPYMSTLYEFGAAGAVGDGWILCFTFYPYIWDPACWDTASNITVETAIGRPTRKRSK